MHLSFTHSVPPRINQVRGKWVSLKLIKYTHIQTLLNVAKINFTRISIQINNLKLISLIAVLLTFNQHSSLTVATIIKGFDSGQKMQQKEKRRS